MTISDILAWTVGIGSLLYFGFAMLKPTWFLGDEEHPLPPTIDEEEDEALWPLASATEDWQYLGQPR